MRFRLLSLGVLPWNGPWMNRQHLTSRLAAQNPCLYSNGPPYVWDIRQGRFQWNWGHVSLANNVLIDHTPSWLPRWPRKRTYETRILRWHARRWLRLLGHTDLPLVILVFDPHFFPFVQHLESDVLAYHAYDLLEAMPGWSSELEALEDSLLRAAVVRTASSQATCDRLSSRSGQAVEWLPNGVDVSRFQTVIDSDASIPSDIAAIPHPRFGWIGSLHTGLDFGLVHSLAQSRPDFHFLFVGPEPVFLSQQVASQRNALRLLPNVHFLPARSQPEAIQAMLAMDANLMLYRIEAGSWTTAGQPLKLFEYLAAGRPIVSTPMPAVMPFARDGMLSIANDHDGWLDALDRALTPEPPGVSVLRRQTAAANDWNMRSALLDEKITAALARKQLT